MGRAVPLLTLGSVVLAVAIALPAAAHGQTLPAPGDDALARQVPPPPPPLEQAQPEPVKEGSTPPQQQPPPAPDSEGPSDVESTVGYIESAIPMNVFVLRFDAAYGANSPSRAEFLYGKPQQFGGRGPELPERRLDFQQLTSKLEVMAVPGTLSGFLEVPFLWTNPEFNENDYGFGDLYGGFKWAFYRAPDSVATFQLRGSIPTRAGPTLGTNHYSIEPGLLMYHHLPCGVTVESELRYWIPVGGTDYEGEVIRYGVGVSYRDRRDSWFWVAPVVELVGWTVLNGKQAVAQTPTDFVQLSAAGDTIVNLKLGLRAGLGQLGDAYLGYGHSLTDDRWYRDVFRVELRMKF